MPCGPWQSLKQCSHLSEVSPSRPAGHSTGSEDKANQVHGELPCCLSHNKGTKLPAASGLGMLWVPWAKGRSWSEVLGLQVTVTKSSLLTTQEWEDASPLFSSKDDRCSWGLMSQATTEAVLVVDD